VTIITGAEGIKLINEYKCLRCHQLDGIGQRSRPRGGSVGPDLSAIASQRNWAELYAHLLKPDARQERNPLVLERVAISNARVRNAAGKRRLFSDPANVALNKAAANWEMKNNFPARRGHWCHMGDAMTYPLCRLYPRARPKTAYEYKRVEPGRSARRRDLDEL